MLISLNNSLFFRSSVPGAQRWRWIPLKNRWIRIFTFKRKEPESLTQVCIRSWMSQNWRLRLHDTGCQCRVMICRVLQTITILNLVIVQTTPLLPSTITNRPTATIHSWAISTSLIRQVTCQVSQVTYTVSTAANLQVSLQANSKVSKVNFTPWQAYSMDRGPRRHSCRAPMTITWLGDTYSNRKPTNQWPPPMVDR